jgi:uncharacterized protein (DUF983 family)
VSKVELNGVAGHGTAKPAVPESDREYRPVAYPKGFFSWLWAMLRARCPRCRQGRMFRGSLTMNDPCPVCGLLFQREEGYFLGAMYCSYVLSSVILGAFYFTAEALLPGVNGALLVLLVLIPYLPLVPAVFRYSRVLWIYVERAGSPVDESAGAYEKQRTHQLETGETDPPTDAYDRP